MNEFARHRLHSCDGLPMMTFAFGLSKAVSVDDYRMEPAMTLFYKRHLLILIALWGMSPNDFSIAEDAPKKAPQRPYSIPLIDLTNQNSAPGRRRQTGRAVSRSSDNRFARRPTKQCSVSIPRATGAAAIVYKRSTDAGKTWSKRLPTPKSWATSKEVPTLHRVIGPDGKKRLIMFSGLYPCRMAVSEDDGKRWSELKPIGEWGGIVTMGCVEALKTGRGHYMALFHDDGRFFTSKPNRNRPANFKLYKTFSRDGGLTWSFPEVVFQSTRVHLCEPGIIRSPDGKQLAVLLRENARRKNSHIIFSNDEGKTWTKPREMPATLNGDRHTGKYAPDGRLFISFRSRFPRGSTKAKTEGDWIAWVGTYEDLVKGREGQYVVRLKDNHKGADCAYPGVEVLPDGTFVTTTYGHWARGKAPYILSVRLKLSELDELAKRQKTPSQR